MSFEDSSDKVSLKNGEAILDTINSDHSYSLDEAIEHLGFGTYQVHLMLICAAFVACEYIELMLITFLMPEVQIFWKLHGFVDGLVGASTFIGMLVGAFVCTPLADKKGRKFVMKICLLTNILGAFVSIVSLNVGMLIACRFVVGFSSTAIYASSYTLLAELVPVKHRAQSLLLVKTAFTCGSLASALFAWLSLGYFEWGWRFFLLLCAIPMLFLVPLLLKIPESPRYLWISGQNNELSLLLNTISLQNRRSLPLGKLQDASIQILNTERGNFCNIFTPNNLKSTICLSFFFFAFAASYYAITFITPRIFIEDKFKVVFITTFAEFPGRLITIFLVDRFGRKYSLSASMGLLCLVILILALYHAVGLLATIVLCLARVVGGMAWGIGHLYMIEYYPTVIRATAGGWFCIVSRLSGILATMLVSGFNPFVGMIPLSAMCFLSSICILFIPIDTVGKQLRDCQPSEI